MAEPTFTELFERVDGKGKYKPYPYQEHLTGGNGGTDCSLISKRCSARQTCGLRKVLQNRIPNQMKYDELITVLNDVDQSAKTSAAKAVNRGLVLRNWLLGAYLVEFEQNGEDRATYGTKLLKRIANDLQSKGVRGVSSDMLERMRRLFLNYPQFDQAISTSPSRKFLLSRTDSEKSATVLRKSSENTPTPPMRRQPIAECQPKRLPTAQDWKTSRPFV